MNFLNCILFCLALSSAKTLPLDYDLMQNSFNATACMSEISSAQEVQIENIDININSSTDDSVQVFKTNDNFIYLTKDDIYLMAQIVYAESKGEPYEGKIAVASVILNRVLDPKFPQSISGVIFQPNAFSCVVDGTISVTPTDECFSAVYDAIEGNDPTGEALFFYNPEIATCSWMINIDKNDSKSIGHHLFFK